MADDYEGRSRGSEYAFHLRRTGDFFIELMNHALPEEKSSPAWYSWPASWDRHGGHQRYALRGEGRPHPTHDVLLCIQTNSTLDRKTASGFSADQFYLSDYEEMKRSLRGRCRRALLHHGGHRSPL